MKLGPKGEAYFPVATDNLEIPIDGTSIDEMMCSPIPSPPFSDDEELNLRPPGELAAEVSQNLMDQSMINGLDGHFVSDIKVSQSLMDCSTSLRQKRSKSSQQYNESINRINQFRCSLSDEEDDDSDTEQDANSLLTADSQITMLDGVPFGKNRRKAKSSSESIQPTRCSSQPLDYESHGDDGVEWAYGNPVPQIIKSSKSIQRNSLTSRIPTSKSESHDLENKSTLPDTLPQQALPHYLSDSGLSNSNMSVQDENSVLHSAPLQSLVSLPNSNDSINPDVAPIPEIPIEALLDMDANTRMHYGLANSGATNKNPTKTQQFELSLYGEPKEGIDAKKWSENIVSFEKFCADPYKIMSNPDLRVKYNNKYMTWHDVAPYMVSLQVFGKKLCNSYRETDRIRHLSTRSYLDNKQVSCESESIRKSESKEDSDKLIQAEVETTGVDSADQIDKKNELEKTDLKEDSEKAAVKSSYFSFNLFRSPTTEPLKTCELPEESHRTPQASASNPQISKEESDTEIQCVQKFWSGSKIWSVLRFLG